MSTQPQPQAGTFAKINELLALIPVLLGLWAQIKTMLPARAKPVLLPGAESVPHPAQVPTLNPLEIDDVIAPRPAAKPIKAVTCVLFQYKLNSERFPDEPAGRVHYPKQGNAIPFLSKVWLTTSAFVDASRSKASELTEAMRVAAGLVFQSQFYVKGPSGAIAHFIGAGWDGVTLMTAEDGYPNLIGRPKPNPYDMVETDDVGWGAQALYASLGANIQGQFVTEGQYELWSIEAGIESAHQTWTVS